MNDFWKKQDAENPLFGDVIWSRPENKKLRKKLLIVGGNPHSFTKIAASYQRAIESGIGECRVVLPDKLEKVIGHTIEDVKFLPSSGFGGISSESVSMLHEYSTWADGIYFPGELGGGSQTSLFIEKFVTQSNLPIVLAGDSLDALAQNLENLFDREDTLVIAEFDQLQKITPKLGIGSALTNSMGLLQLVDILHQITQERQSIIMTNHQGNTIVAMYGEVSSTRLANGPSWQISLGTRAAVFFLQYPQKPFEAITSSLAIAHS